MPRPVHFEIAVEDPERVGRFYSEVFGWEVEPYRSGGDMDYWLIKTGEDGELGINGGLLRLRPGAPQCVNTIGVASLDESVAQIEAAGGAVAIPPMEIENMGRVAYCTDPGGTVFGVFEPTSGG